MYVCIYTYIYGVYRAYVGIEFESARETTHAHAHTHVCARTIRTHKSTRGPDRGGVAWAAHLVVLLKASGARCVGFPAVVVDEWAEGLVDDIVCLQSRQRSWHDAGTGCGTQVHAHGEERATSSMKY